MVDICFTKNIDVYIKPFLLFVTENIVLKLSNKFVNLQFAN